MSAWRQILPGGHNLSQHVGVCKLSQRTKKKRNAEHKQQKPKIQTVFSTTENNKFILKNSIRSNSDNEIWGDPIGMKNNDEFRIVIKQIGGMGIDAGNPKELELKEWLGNIQADCCGLIETNVYWGKCRDRARFNERMRHGPWEHIRTSTAYNRKEFTGRAQYGGTAMICFDQLAHRASGTGADNRGLGRWSWIMFRGKNNTNTRIISAYQPNVILYSENLGSVYKQHERHLLSNNIDSDPVDVFRDDLCKAISQWISKGEKIILMIDANEDVRSGVLSTRLRQLGLISPLQSKFGGHSMPPTFHRGSAPIDDIFVSPSLRVEKSGMLEFGNGPGDHRAIYLDVKQTDLIGIDPYKIHRQQARRLISTNPVVVDRFNRDYEYQLSRNHVHEQMEQLYQTCSNPMTCEQIEHYEKLDRIMVSAFHYANKRCRKLRMGAIPSSEELTNAGTHIQLWRNVIRKKVGCKISSKLIQRLACDCDVNSPMSTTLQEAILLRSEAWKNYYQAKDDAYELRENKLDTLAEIIAEQEGEEKATVIRKRKLNEEVRYSHRQIKYARGKHSSGGTMKLHVKGADGSISEVTDKEEMEDILMQANEEKFRSASDTPFAIEPLKSIVGPCAMTREAELMLQGQYSCPENIHKGAKDFIAATAMPSRIISSKPVSSVITPDQHRTFWKSQRESTQSSPSGMHFGFMKATCKDDKLNTTMARLVSIPYETGYSPLRWRSSINVTVPKEEGAFAPEKQRTIHLLESTFTEGTKIIFSRRMMRHARENSIMPADQYAQKGSKSIDAAVQKVLIFDVLRLRRQSGTGFASDLMSNYDRMVHGASGLALRHLGAPPSAVRCMSDTVMNMKHFIRTAYGDSDKHYGGDPNSPLQGGGQGSPAAPPMWLAMTVVLLRIASHHEPGFTLTSSISNLLVAFSAIMYVDDTDLFTMAKQDETNQQLCDRTQKLADKWIDGLYATGAVLRPEKCWWLFIAFVWEGSKWRYMNSDEEDHDLIVPDVNGMLQSVKRINFDTQKRTLGVRMAGNGCMTSKTDKELGEFEYLRDCSTNWAESISKSYLTRNLSSMALRTTIAKTWTYPLAATKFTKKQCELIMKPVYTKILPKMGFNRHLPRAFRFAPLSHQGQDLPHVLLLQGTEQIKLFLSHIARGSHVGNIVESCLESASLEIGVGGNIFLLDYDLYGDLLTDCWVKVLWKFCFDYNVSLKGVYQWPKLQRQNDRFLMQTLIEDKNDIFSRGEIRLINRCRLYLQLMTLADAYNGDGTTYTHKVCIGERDRDRQSCWGWPNQAAPSKREWSVWRRCLRQIWSIHATDTNIIKLGLWTSNCHQIWHWYTDEEHIYYRVHQQCWKKYVRMSNRVQTRMQRYTHDGTYLCRAPTNLVRTTIKRIDDDTVSQEGYCGSEMSPIDKQKLEVTIESAIQRAHPSLKQMLEKGRWSDDGHGMALALAAGTGRCVVDGSFHPEHKIGTAAWVLDDGDDNIQSTGSSRAFGNPTDMSSYRAELFGIYMALNLVHLLCNQFHITDGAIEIGCDNIVAIQKGLAEQFYPSIQHNNFDLLWAIHSLRDKIPIDIYFRHVRGHQDDIEGAVLDRWAQLNVIVDNEAKMYLSRIIQDPKIDSDIELVSPHWNVEMNGQVITAKVSSTIMDNITCENMKQFLIKTNKLTKATYDMVDWAMSGRAIRSMSCNDRTWVTKFASGFCGTASMMSKWKEGGWESSLCPRCGLCDETTEHILWCTFDPARDCRHQATLHFVQWLNDNHTEPSLLFCITQILQKGPTTSFKKETSHCINPKIKQLGCDQDLIGFMNFFRGRISKRWYDIQDDYLCRSHVPTKKRGSTWTSGFIRQIYKWSRALWDDRNNTIHSRDAALKASIMLSDTDQKILREFETGISGIRARDQKILLDKSVDEILSKRLEDKLNWLRQVKVVRKRAEEAESTQMDRMRRFMEKWKRRKKNN